MQPDNHLSAQPEPHPYTRFQELDVFNQALSGWDLDFRQLNEDQFDAVIAAAGVPNCALNHISIHQKVQQQGATPGDNVTFGLLAEGTAGLRWCGHDVTDQTLERFHAGTAFECVSDQDFDVQTFSFPAETYFSAADAMEIQLSAGEDATVLTPNADSLSTIRALGTDMLRMVGGPGIDRQVILRGLADDLLVKILECSNISEDKAARPAPASRRAVRQKAISYIHTNGHQPLSIGTLCREISVSWRQLDYAFKEQFGMTPKAYLTLFRLDGLRSELLASSCETRITQAAGNWGFSHFGQLAKDYYHQFGELPSETLKQQPKGFCDTDRS